MAAVVEGEGAEAGGPALVNDEQAADAAQPQDHAAEEDELTEGVGDLDALMAEPGFDLWVAAQEYKRRSEASIRGRSRRTRKVKLPSKAPVPVAGPVYDMLHKAGEKAAGRIGDGEPWLMRERAACRAVWTAWKDLENRLVQNSVPVDRGYRNKDGVGLGGERITALPHLCWEGRAENLRRGGYWVISIGGQQVYAHRLAAMLDSEQAPRAMVAGHKCDNPRCASPSHLEWVTPEKNRSDMVRRGRARYFGRAMTAAQIEAVGAADDGEEVAVGRKVATKRATTKPKATNAKATRSTRRTAAKAKRAGTAKAAKAKGTAS